MDADADVGGEPTGGGTTPAPRRPTGSITDVAGVRVGQVTRRGGGWLTGVTVVLPSPGTVAGVDVRGGGPGTHETDALDPTTLVPTADAVVLTGGSAYGLVAAHGAQRWCEEHGRGFPVGPGQVVPIVPAAAIFDLGRGGDFSARPREGDGYDAAAAAASPAGSVVERGRVGAGTGALVDAGRRPGGVGTASVRVRVPGRGAAGGDGADGGDGEEVVVGALAVVNARGTPTTGVPSTDDAVRGRRSSPSTPRWS